MGKQLPKFKSDFSIGLMVALSLVLFLIPVQAKPSSAETKALTIAKKAFQDTQYDVSSVKLQEFQKAYPKSELAGEAALLLGQSLFFQGNKEKALELFQNPPASLNEEQKGSFAFWKAETLFGQEKWAAAVEAYQAFSKTYPTHSRLNEATLHLSESLLYSKKSDEAIASLAPLLNLKTTDKARHPAVLLQARILVAASRYAEADALLDMLLKEKLERTVLYPAAYLAGEVNAELKDYAAAKASFRKVTGDGRAYPKNLVTEAWLGLGAAEEAELKWIEAGEAYEKALETADRPVLVERSVVRYLSAHAKAGTLAKATLKVRDLARNRKEIGGLGFYAIGKFYFEEKNYDASIAELDNFISSSPDSSWVPAASLLIADSLYRKKDIEAATQALNTLIAGKKDKEVPIQARLRLAEINYEQGEFSQAAANFLGVAEAGSQTPDLTENAWFRGLISLAKASSFEEFSKQLQVFNTKFPKSSRKNELLLEQASLLDQQGKGDEARKIYETVAAESAESKAEALLRLGRSAIQSPPDYEKAISTLTQLEKEYPNYTFLDQAVYLRIKAQVDSGVIMEKQARSEYESFIKRFPDSPEVPLFHFKIAESYSLEGNYAEAQARFEKLAADFPKQKDHLADYALYRAGLSAMAQAEAKAAVQILEKIPADSPAKTPARLAQIRCYMSQSNYLDAIRICDSVLLNRKEDDVWAEASLRKANCLYTLAAEDPKKYPQALEIVSKILASKETTVHQRNEAGYLKGTTLQKMGKESEAMEGFLDVIYGQALPTEITGQPQHPEFYWFIKSGLAAATIREDKGDVRGAVEIYHILERLGDPNREEFRRRIEMLKSKNFLYEES